MAWLLACVALGGALSELLRVDRWLDARHDWQTTWLAPQSPERAARMVDVDEESLRRLGAWPLRREVYVPAADWLVAQGARAVVFGLLLVDERAGDAAFGRWVSQPDRPVLLGARSLQGRGDPPPAQGASAGCRPVRWAGWQLPVWARETPGQSAMPVTRVGALSAPLDGDGVLRRWPLWQQAGDLALPTLPLAVWRMLHPEQAASLRCEDLTADRARLLADDGRSWPLDGQHDIRLWLAQADSQPAPLPLWRVAAAAAGELSEADQAALAAEVRGRVVFIGGSAPTLGEAALTAQGWRNPTQVLAAGFDALEHHQALVPPSVRGDLQLLAVLLLPGLGALWLASWPGRLRLEPLLGLVGLALVGLFVADLALVAQAGRLNRIGWPLLALLLMGATLAWARHRQVAIDEGAREDARRQAVAVARARSEFVAHVSHEVRTPLNALLGAAQLLQSTPLSDEQRRHVVLFSSAGQELLDMLNDLLDLSKSEAGLLLIERRPFSLSEVVAHQIALFDAPAQQKGLVLQTEVEEELPEVVLGDPQRLAQVLRNLLSNAVKFTPVGRVTLAIGFGRLPNHLHFEVRDTGIGIPADRLGRLFMPYSQAHDAGVQRYGGSGLGLAISRQLAVLMGGQIGVQSRPGLGSVFELDLPLPESDAVPERVPAELFGRSQRATDLHASRQALPQQRVLAADDSVLNLMLLRAFLEEAGFEVDTAVDGAAALRQFERRSYHLVLLDLNMPVMDGMAAVQAMRVSEQRRSRPATRIVAVSGQVDAADVQGAISAGFDAHIAKPYTRDQLLDQAMGPCRSDGGRDGVASGPMKAANSSWMDRMSRLPDSDLSAAISRLGSEVLFDRVLDAARTPMLEFESRLDLLLQAGSADAEAAERLVHNLKTLAATVGLLGLAADADRLERALRDSPAVLQDAEVATARQQVLQRLAPVCQTLRDELAKAATVARAVGR